MLQEDKSKERGAIRLRVLHYVNESVLSWSVPFLQLLRALEDKGINNVVLCSPGGRLSKEVEKIGVECVVAKPLFPWCPRLCKIIGKKIADAHLTLSSLVFRPLPLSADIGARDFRFP